MTYIACLPASGGFPSFIQALRAVGLIGVVYRSGHPRIAASAALAFAILAVEQWRWLRKRGLV